MLCEHNRSCVWVPDPRVRGRSAGRRDGPVGPGPPRISGEPAGRVMSEAYHEHEKLSREYLGLLRGDEPVDPRVEDDLIERINDMEFTGTPVAHNAVIG